MLTSEIILSQLNFDKWRINLFWIGVLEEKQVNSKKVLILLIKIFIILMLNLSGKMPVNNAIRVPQILETHLIYAWFHWAKKWSFSVMDFFSKFLQIRRKLHIRLHLLEKSSRQNFFFALGSSICDLHHFWVQK